MTALIKGVLEYSRLSKAEEQFEEVNLDRILENVETDFELIIHQKKAIIRHGKLPVIRGIAMQLYQLFANIIGNSLKFSSERPVIDIGSRNLPPDAPASHPLLNAARQYVELTFRDNGIGFEQKYAQQVFTIFRRLNNRQSYHGTGIGLALCKKIVENHRGVIEAISEPNRGTTFKVYLPVG